EEPGPAVPAFARDLRQGRRVRPVGRGGLHQAVGPRRAHRVAGAGPAPRARAERPAGRCEEARAIARKGAKLWGGRFSGALLPELERFSSSLEVDFELYPFDLAGSVAHARGLAAAGIIKRTQLAAIERGLRRIRRELDEGEFDFTPADEDIHTAVERRLTELTPAGAALHAGRSRNDQVVLDLRLYTRLASATAVDAIGSLVETLSDAATKHAAWPMPGYTHLQRAQPVTLGHHLLA